MEAKTDKGTKDYAELLKELSFEEVFITRNKEYLDSINDFHKRRKQ